MMSVDDWVDYLMNLTEEEVAKHFSEDGCDE
jgi:hypothetical protein